MPDGDIKSQLSTVFAPLEKTIELVYAQSSHADQSQLIEMLNGVASTSEKIKSKAGSENSPFPAFRIYKDGRPTGILFSGIPTGHEFTSLIVAILNTDGKGRMPDAGMIKRIQRLRGPVRIKTYISLTCENCPDVVQALNQMALIHPDFTHEMIDGGYVPDEISSLSIQGVPSVVVDTKLIHSGRIQFLDLVVKLEEAFGSQADAARTAENLGEFDVVVVGGGPAGASAAIYSVRKGLKTALITEKVGGQVNETKGIENLISVVYTEGPELSAQLYKHLTSYPVQLLENRRVLKIKKGEIKTITLEDGDTLTGKSIIVTTGARWRQLGIPGEKDYMGRGVVFCPHCDGPFYKGKKIAVVGGGNSGVEAAIDLAGIVSEVTLFEYQDTLKADKVLVDKLKALPNAHIVTGAKTTQVLGDGTKVNALEYQDRKTEKTVKLDLDGIFVQIGLLPNSQFLKETVELTQFGEVVIDSKCRTSEPGIYAAGDVTTTPFKQIVIAMGEGAKAALTAFEDNMYKAP